MPALTEPGKKIARDFEALMSYRDKGFSYPRSAEVDLTSRCSLNCKLCHSKHLHKPEDLEPKEINRILSQLSIHGCKTVIWSGGGDPLESPYWKEAMMAGLQFGLKQGLYSYMPEPCQDKISFIESFMEFVYSHPFQTRGLKRENRNCTWTAGFLLDSENWKRVSKMVESVDLRFFDHVDFRPLAPPNIPNAGTLDYRWVPECVEFLKDLSANNPQVTWASYKFADTQKSNYGRDYDTCQSTDFVAVIGSDGSMWECVQRRGFVESKLGNLLQEDLSDIWEAKSHCRANMSECRIMCRNQELNKTLFDLLGPPLKHQTFV